MIRRKYIASAAIALAGVATPFAAHASTRASNLSLVRTAFHLQAESGLPPTTTYWVAYGPVAGKFGLIRLRNTGHGQFTAAGWFPSGTRATFYYIEGQGTIQTKAGPAPGNPVHTIGHTSPVIIGRQAVPLFRVPAPAG